MVELLKYLGISAIPQALLLIAIGFWGKKLVEGFFTKGLEIKKIELQNELEKSKIQFSRLHHRRAEVIEQLYVHLVELNSAMIDLTRRIHPIIEDEEKESQERIIRANQSLMNFRDFFQPNKIYFDRELAEKIDGLHKMYWDKGWDFNYINSRLKSGKTLQNTWKDFMEESKKITTAVDVEIPPILTELEEEFRDMLGVYEVKIDS